MTPPTYTMLDIEYWGTTMKDQLQLQSERPKKAEKARAEKVASGKGEGG